ncbi:MAG: hypothetical protein AB7F98_15830, partial [Novosphingobium sp.]
MNFEKNCAVIGEGKDQFVRYRCSSSSIMEGIMKSFALIPLVALTILAGLTASPVAQARSKPANTETQRVAPAPKPDNAGKWLDASSPYLIKSGQQTNAATDEAANQRKGPPNQNNSETARTKGETTLGDIVISRSTVGNAGESTAEGSGTGSTAGIMPYVEQTAIQSPRDPASGLPTGKVAQGANATDRTFEDTLISSAVAPNAGATERRAGTGDTTRPGTIDLREPVNGNPYMKLGDIKGEGTAERVEPNKPNGFSWGEANAGSTGMGWGTGSLRDPALGAQSERSTQDSASHAQGIYSANMGQGLHVANPGTQGPAQLDASSPKLQEVRAANPATGQQGHFIGE